MSQAEIVGLLLTVALMALAAGALVASVAYRFAVRDARQRVDLTEAYVQWLAARRTLTRVTLSFVAAFRALAVTDRASLNRSLREEESQRARADWSSAMRSLEEAHTRLCVCDEDDGMAQRLTRFAVVTPEQIRKAISGDADIRERMAGELADADRRAMAFVRIQLHRRRARHGMVRMTLDRIGVWAGSVGRS